MAITNEKRTVIYMHHQWHRELAAEAQRQDRSLAWLLRKIIGDWMERNINPKDV